MPETWTDGHNTLILDPNGANSTVSCVGVKLWRGTYSEMVGTLLDNGFSRKGER